MKNKKTINVEKVEIILKSIGINLNSTESLLNLLENSITNRDEIKMSDIENTISIIKKQIKETIKEHDKLEKIYEI